MTAFTFLVGCATCTSVATTFTDLDRRQQFMDSHVPGHVVAPFVAATEHPDATPSGPPTFAAGDAVTFYGSTTDQGAGLQSATVSSAIRGTDQDGTVVDGYLITVPVQLDDTSTTYNLFAPTAGLALA